MTENLTDKFDARFSGYVTASHGWYVREQDNEGYNIYYPILAWRECTGKGPLRDGVLLPVLACGAMGKTPEEMSGSAMYVPDERLMPNGDGTYRDKFC